MKKRDEENYSVASLGSDRETVRDAWDEDRELVARAQNGDLDAEEALMRKYKDVVRIKSHYYYMAGADEDDVVQEGMIGLLKAIRQYDDSREASFGTFAGVCVTRQIISAIRMADREKHKPLNTSISLNRPLTAGSEDVTLEDTLRASGEENPETFLVARDIASYLMNNDDKIFSNFEMQVLNEAVKERNYTLIASKLGRSNKSIENAMQRIKKKIVAYLWG